MKELVFSIPGEPSVPGYTVQGPPSVPTGNTITSNLLPAVVALLFGVAVFLAFIFLIFAGIQWITSEGDKQKIAAARRRIIFTVVGIIVASLAFLIITFVMGLFGITFSTLFTIK
jgi:amino acid transporter